MRIEDAGITVRRSKFSLEFAKTYPLLHVGLLSLVSKGCSLHMERVAQVKPRKNASEGNYAQTLWCCHG